MHTSPQITICRDFNGVPYREPFPTHLWDSFIASWCRRASWSRVRDLTYDLQAFHDLSNSFQSPIALALPSWRRRSMTRLYQAEKQRWRVWMKRRDGGWSLSVALDTLRYLLDTLDALDTYVALDTQPSHILHKKLWEQFLLIVSQKELSWAFPPSFYQNLELLFCLLQNC